MLIFKDETLSKIILRLEDMHILLGDEIINHIAIMCIHSKKRWSGHSKIHLKKVQEDEIKLR